MEFRVLPAQEIGERIRTLRVLAGLSQQDLGIAGFGSKKIETAQMAIRRLENGQPVDTSWQKMATIAQVLAKSTELPVRDVLEFFEGHRDELTVKSVARPTLRVLEGENKPDYGVPSSKSRSRRAPKKQADQTNIGSCSSRRPEQPIRVRACGMIGQEISNVHLKHSPIWGRWYPLSDISFKPRCRRSSRDF